MMRMNSSSNCANGICHSLSLLEANANAIPMFRRIIHRIFPRLLILLRLPLLLFVICSIFIDGASSSSSSSSSSSFSGPADADSFQRQLIMAADGLPRDEIALLYQRLKSADGTGGRSRSGKGRGTTNGTSKISQGRRKIVPPIVSAVFTSPSWSSSTVPTTRFPSKSTSSNSSHSSKTPSSSSTIANSSPPPPPSAQIWLPSFFQISRVTAIVLIGLFFSLATTIGNALVMLSIFVDRKLQTISNYFLFSLAVADLTIGLISIPLMTLYTANESWSFGYALCQFWLCIDYLMCNASVLNLLLISFDRYFSVTRPLTYRPKRTTRKAMFMIAATYTISLILWPPWIVLWPYFEGRFIIEENAICVVQFLALGNNRNWRNQLATVVTAAAAFYIPVTLMIVLYYKVYLETQRRQKELRKLQDGQIRGLQSPSDHSLLPSSFARQSSVTIPTPPPPPPPPPPKQQQPSSNDPNSRLNFMELVSNTISTLPAGPTFKKKERFSLLKYCTGKAQTDISSEDSVDDVAGMEETCALTTSNLDSILADQMAVELAAQSEVEREMAREKEGAKEEDAEKQQRRKKAKENSAQREEGGGGNGGNGNALELGRTSRPSSVHTYNSIVIIEYPDSTSDERSKRPSVRLSSHAEVESLSARNSVERRLEKNKEEEGKRPTRMDSREKEERENSERMAQGRGEMSGSERQKLRLTKSCPSGPQPVPQTASTTGGGGQLAAGRTSAGQQNGGALMKKSEIQLLREEQMRRSEKERRRNERKQESKAAKTLSAILFAFIITWTPYNVIVILEAFYPNSVPASLFTLSYFLSYVNSTINPLCYALCNARFRMTYLHIIRCKWGRRNSGGALSPFEGGFINYHHRHQRGGSGRRVLLKGRHHRTGTTTADT